MLSNQSARTEPKYWADVYTDVAKLYNQNDSARKRRMYVYIRQYVKELVAKQLTHLRNLNGPELLAEYCRTWKLTMQFAEFMKRVLHHLHHFWIRQNANTVKNDPVRPLDKLLMFYWREELLSKLQNVVAIAMQLVASDRKGDKIDHTVIKGVVDTLVIIGQADVPAPDPQSKNHDPSSEPSNLSLYIRVFEDEFLAVTRAFYKAEGDKIATCGDVTKYMKAVLARLNEEDQRGRRLLHPDSVPRLRQAIEEQLIGNHLHYLQEEAKEMIRAGREEDLKLAYSLLNRIENGLNPLRTFFVSFVRGEGNSVVVNHIDKVDGKDDLQSNLGLVRVLVRLYRKHSSLVKRCFDGSGIIMMAIDDAFRGFANRSLGPISLPILMAHYIDHLLRLGKSFDRGMWDNTRDGRASNAQSNKDAETVDEKQKYAEESVYDVDGNSLEKSETVSELHSASRRKESKIGECNSEDNELLSKYISELVRVFMYLDDKDLFFETHRRLFAKRLMTSHDEELETVFIARVKTQMGPTFTQRLSGMLKDKLVSNSTRAEFTKYLHKKRKQFNELREKSLTSFSFTPATRKDAVVIGKTADCDRDAFDVRTNDVLRAVSSQTTANVGSIPNTNNTIVQTLGSEQSGNNVALLANAATLAASSMSRANTDAEAVKLGGNDKNNEGDSGKEKGSRESLIIKGISDLRELKSALCVDFNAHVLNALHWPAAKVTDLYVPPVLKACQQMFSDFYMQDKETRKLSWIHSLSTVFIAAIFCGKRYLLVMSTFQASVLMLFNERDSISVGKACKLLNISKDELCEHVKPLILSRKCKLLTVERREAEDDEDNNTNEISTGSLTNGHIAATVENSEASPGPIEARRNQEHLTDSCSGKRRRTEGATAMEVGSKKIRYEGQVAKRLSNTQDSSSSEPESALMDTNEETQPLIVGCVPESGHPEKSVVQTIPTQRKQTRNNSTTPHASKNCDNMMQAQDLLHLNLSFHSKLVRIHVPTSITRVESTEAVASKRNVVVDRSTQVDAALVRILKARKEMTHTTLNAEVIASLAPMFLPDPRMIKSRLERLIDQEYVERDSNDARLYRYSA